MKAAIYEKFGGVITIQNVKDPAVRDHGVIIEVKATGLCRSDWHGWVGHEPDITLPHVPGHELVGVISETGKNVRQFQVGERVTVPFVCGCGTCQECRSGNHQVCGYQSQPGFTHWGSFAQYVAIDFADTNLVKVPEEIDDVTAATLGCRFVTSYRAVVEQGKVKGGQYVAVHGCGGVGLSAIMIASALGAQVIAIDVNEQTLNLAQQIGATQTINASHHQNIVEAIQDSTQGGAHISLDALGSQSTCFNSIASLRKRGRHIQVGLMTAEHQHPQIPMDKVIADELEIIGSHGMQAFQYPDMLELIKSGKLNPQQLIERTITLEQATMELPQMNQFANQGILVINSF